MNRVLETVGYRSPLALSCVDTVTGAPIAAGLIAAVWPAGDLDGIRFAQRSPYSPLLGFHGLPGLARYEHSAATGAGLPNLGVVAPRYFLVAVADESRRFLPILQRLAIPVEAPVSVPLYSAPSRPVPPGWATIRGEVHSGGSPAAWSVVSVDTGADRYETVADSAGRFLLYLPYPDALPPLIGSPPVGHGLGEVSWPITVSVGYEPTALQWLVATQPPSLDSILNQSEALLDAAGGLDPDLQATLVFGAALTMSVEATPT